jgi:hypothetical protein
MIAEGIGDLLLVPWCAYVVIGGCGVAMLCIGWLLWHTDATEAWWNEHCGKECQRWGGCIIRFVDSIRRRNN